MALGARLTWITIRNVAFLMNAALGDVPDGYAFLGRQPMERAEISGDETPFLRGERNTLHKNHSFQRILPAFGRGPCPGNALHISLVVRRVHAYAVGDH